MTRDYKHNPGSVGFMRFPPMIDVVYFQVCVTARSWHGTSGSLSSLSPRPGRLTKDLVTVANALETRKRRRPVEDFGGRVKDCSLTPKSFRTLSPVKDTQSMKKGGGMRSILDLGGLNKHLKTFRFEC